MLAALTVRPRSRSELSELTAVSSSTVRRTLREFEDRNWIRRNEYQYETTALGASVASAMVDLIDRIETQQQLRDVWKWLPGEEHGFSIDMCAEATVTIADGDGPYRPVNRFRALLDEANQFRLLGFDIAMLELCKDDLCERIIGGMEAEIINQPRVADYIRNNCPEPFSRSLESGNLTIRLHDNLPHFGLCLMEDRMAITGYDNDAVTVRVLVDTDRSAAKEWAESMYAPYLRETPTISLDVDGQPDRA